MVRRVASRRRSTIVRRPRRRMIWARETFSLINSLGGTNFAAPNVLSGIETQVGGDLVGATIMAIRGSFSARWAIGASALSGTVDVVTAGLAVVDLNDTFTAAYTAEIDRYDGKWMYWDSIPIMKAATNYTVDQIEHPVVVRSKRVIKSPNEVLRLSIRTGELGATVSGADVNFSMSVLLALP